MSTPRTSKPKSFAGRRFTAAILGTGLCFLQSIPSIAFEYAATEWVGVSSIKLGALPGFGSSFR